MRADPTPRLAAVLVLAALLSLGTAAAGPPRPPEMPQAERIGEDIYRLGNLTVNLKTKTASCAGRVNMQRGLVEYLAVAPGGKLHESLLSVDVRPLHLQVGLILLGLEPKGGLSFQGDTAPPRGSPVNVWVSWKRGGRTVRVHAEDLVWDVERKAPMPRGAWVFSGSRVDERGFAADLELSLVGTFRDPAAIINNALPGGSDDSLYKVNERIAPAWGTPVTFSVSPAR